MGMGRSYGWVDPMASWGFLAWLGISWLGPSHGWLEPIVGVYLWLEPVWGACGRIPWLDPITGDHGRISWPDPVVGPMYEAHG